MLEFQLQAGPDGEVADQYGGTEETSHSLTGIAAVYLVDEEWRSDTNRSRTILRIAPTGTGSGTSSDRLRGLVRRVTPQIRA